MSARAEYRKRTQQRQTVVFGSILATMGVLLVLAMLVWSGIMPVPFERKFSEAPDPNRAITPCLPTDPTTAVELTTITVNVYNSTNRTGIGGEASGAFTAMGISVPNPASNWSASSMSEPARIIAGPSGVVAAYSLAPYIPDSVIAINPDETTDVLTVVLGSGWDGVKDWRTVYLENPERKLTSVEGCVPTEELKSAEK
ncbi:MAG: LytR C-terminal domain-containing protein [Ancrocorticia sp.]